MLTEIVGVVPLHFASMMPSTPVVMADTIDALDQQGLLQYWVLSAFLSVQGLGSPSEL